MPEKKKNELFAIKEELKKCQQEKDNYLDGWKRTKADLLNHGKREFQRIREAVDQGKQDLFLELLSVEDDLERFKLTINDIATAVRNSNLNITSGSTVPGRAFLGNWMRSMAIPPNNKPSERAVLTAKARAE